MLSGLRTYRREVAAFVAMSVFYACAFFQRVAVPGSIFNELQVDLRMDAVRIASLSSLYLYIYAAFQLIAGFLADRVGGLKLIVIGGFLMVVAAFMFPLSTTAWQAFVARGIAGLGAAAIYLSTVQQFHEIYSSRTFDALIGPLLVAGLLGGLMGTLPFEASARLVGWRPALLIVAGLSLIALIATIVAARTVPRRGHVRQLRPFALRPALMVIFNWRCFPLAMTGSLCFSTYFAIQSVIGKKLLEDHAGMSSGGAASVTFGMMGAAIAGTLMAGPVTRWCGNCRKPVLIGGVVLLVIGLTGGVVGAWWQAGAVPLLIAAYLLTGLASGLAPVYTCLIKELNPPGTVALSVGMFNTATYVVVALMAQLVGMILDAFKSNAVATPAGLLYPASAYQTLLACMLVFAIVALVFACLTTETHGRSVDESGRLPAR